MNVRAWLLRVLGWLEHAAAALLVVILVAFAALCFTKALDRERAGAVWGILRGEKVAVAPADRTRWQELDRQVAARSKMEKEEREGSASARDELEKAKKRLADQLKKESDQLAEISKLVAERESKLGVEMDKLNTDRKAFDAQQKSAQDVAKNASLRKVVKLYAGMDAEAVAKDFESRLRSGGAERASQAKDEVVQILRLMPERQASEVLSAMENSEVRNMLMDALRS